MREDASPHDGITPIGALLDRVLAGLGVPGGRRAASIFEIWPELVGDKIAAHARPLSLDGGTLVVGVDDPAWATELRYRKNDLLARLDAALGPDAVHGLEVRVRL